MNKSHVLSFSGDDFAVFHPVRKEDKMSHVTCLKDISFPWRTSLFKGIIQVHFVKRIDRNLTLPRKLLHLDIHCVYIQNFYL